MDAAADAQHLTARQQLEQWAHLAESNMVTNSLAALEFGRLNLVTVVLLAGLTVVVGSHGLAELASPTRTALGVVVAVCQLLLGVLTAVHTSMELRPKSLLFHHRAAGYARLANDIRAKLMGHAPTQDAAVEHMLVEIPGRIENLEAAAEPLPIRFRRQAQTLLPLGHPPPPLQAHEGNDATVLLLSQQVVHASAGSSTRVASP